MKLLHTSDWHLGKYLNNYSRFPEQQAVLQEICEIAEKEQVNAVLIAGDLFDTYNPPTEATDLFYKTLKKLSDNGNRAVLAIAGNHDSPDRIEAPDPLARECGIIFVGYPNTSIIPFELESGLKINLSEEGFISIQLPGIVEPLRVLLTPYANEYRLKTYLGQGDQDEELRLLLQEKWKLLADKYCDNKGVNILVAHLLFATEESELPEEPDDEKPILHVGGTQIIYPQNIPEQIQYTALGHLHRMQQIMHESEPVFYSGSPLAYSFSEADQDKFVLLTDISAGKQPVIKEIKLTKGKRLLRNHCESIEEAVNWLKTNPEALIEITIATETFLTAEERKKLYAAHNGIISYIPEVKDSDKWTKSSHKNIDISKSMVELFSEYFNHAKGQAPNENILNLFKEALSEEESQ